MPALQLMTAQGRAASSCSPFPQPDRRSLISAALFSASLALVSFSLPTAALASPATSGARAPLADAIEKHDVAAMHALLRDGDVNARQVDGMTALHWAAYNDDLSAAKLLLAGGANVNAENRYGVRPLSLVCANGNGEFVQLLLSAGAEANAPQRSGETPLMTAARTGKLGPVKALLAQGADVNAKMPSGQTALMWAAAEGHTAVVEALVDAKADLRATLGTGFTATLFAARGGFADTVRALIRAGVDVNEPATPVKNANKYLRKGATAITTAIENGHFELAAMLLDLGADPNDMRSGYTPLHILTWIRKPDRGEDEGDPIPEGSGSLTSEELVRKLVAKGANVNAQLVGGPSGGGRINRKGCTPLMMAADTADTAYMKLLVELGADWKITNVDHCSPLMAAAGLGTRSVEEEAGTDDEAIEAVGYLLSLGADINAVADTGDTPMHGAAFANFPKTAKFLAAHGANIAIWNQPNKRGWTPLRIAEGHRYGNFKPSFETVAAIKEVMLAAGVTPPPPMPQVMVKGYGN